MKNGSVGQTFLGMKEMEFPSSLNFRRIARKLNMPHRKLSARLEIPWDTWHGYTYKGRNCPQWKWDWIKEVIKGDIHMGKLSRTKGHSFERWVANKMKKIFPEARRHLEYQDAEAFGVDIANTGIYKIQCKRGKRYASLSAIEEIQIDPIDGGIPLLVTKGDNKEPLVCLPFEHFLHLIKNKV